MHFDPEHWKATILGLGVVRDPETGEIRWHYVAGGILVAATIAVGGFLVSISNILAAVEARLQIAMQRIETLEASQHPATSRRYTSDDANRDLELLRTRIRDAREEARKDSEGLSVRVLRLEDRRR